MKTVGGLSASTLLSPAAKLSAAAPSASTIGLPMNIPGVAREILEKIEGLTVEELVFRKGNSTIAIRPSGIVYGAAALAPQIPDDSLNASEAPQTGAENASPSAKESKIEEAAYTETIDAPFVGTLYMAPGPGKDDFVKEGDVVEAGAKVCIVEAMKLFNEITAPKKCRIVKILAAAGQALEKGQPLMGIEAL